MSTNLRDCRQTDVIFGSIFASLDSLGPIHSSLNQDTVYQLLGTSQAWQ